MEKVGELTHTKEVNIYILLWREINQHRGVVGKNK